MLREGSSDIVSSVEHTTLGEQHAEILSFFDNRVLVITHSAIGFYQDAKAISDPLGNGLIALANLPHAHQFTPDTTPLVTEYRAGCIGLAKGYCLLILPNHIRLYADKDDALKNINPIIELAINT